MVAEQEEVHGVDGAVSVEVGAFKVAGGPFLGAEGVPHGDEIRKSHAVVPVHVAGVEGEVSNVGWNGEGVEHGREARRSLESGAQRPGEAGPHSEPPLGVRGYAVHLGSSWLRRGEFDGQRHTSGLRESRLSERSGQCCVGSEPRAQAMGG